MEKERWSKIIKLSEDGDLDEIKSEEPYVYFQCQRHIRALQQQPKPVSELDPDNLYEWQYDVIRFLEDNDGRPHPRRILVVVDTGGGRGKTSLAKYIINKFDGVQLFGGGKLADLAYMCQAPKIALFDFSRAVEHRPWAFVEDVKNGIVHSLKYDSHTKYFAVPHVIVFTNAPLEENKLSADRVDERYIWGDNKFHSHSE